MGNAIMINPLGGAEGKLILDIPAATSFPSFKGATSNIKKIVLNCPNVDGNNSGMNIFNASNFEEIEVTFSSTQLYNAFAYNPSLKTIRLHGELIGNCNYLAYGSSNLTTVTGLSVAENTNTVHWLPDPARVVNIECVPNGIKSNIEFGYLSSTLTNDSYVSIANGLNESVTGKTVDMRGSQVKLNSIVGTVTIDSTGSYHVFTEGGGTVSLYDFITTTKGWSITL